MDEILRRAQKEFDNFARWRAVIFGRANDPSTDIGSSVDGRSDWIDENHADLAKARNTLRKVESLWTREPTYALVLWYAFIACQSAPPSQIGMLFVGPPTQIQWLRMKQGLRASVSKAFGEEIVRQSLVEWWQTEPISLDHRNATAIENSLESRLKTLQRAYDQYAQADREIKRAREVRKAQKRVARKAA